MALHRGWADDGGAERVDGRTRLAPVQHLDARGADDFYRVWHNAPFAFIIFYAGLQTLDQDAIDASVVDGASRFERFRYVVLPHLMPLVIFVSLIHLMDAYRVFDEVVGFSSQAYVISLQWLTYDLLMPDNTATGR